MIIIQRLILNYVMALYDVKSNKKLFVSSKYKWRTASEKQAKGNIDNYQKFHWQKSQSQSKNHFDINGFN